MNPPQQFSICLTLDDWQKVKWALTEKMFHESEVAINLNLPNVNGKEFDRIYKIIDSEITQRYTNEP